MKKLFLILLLLYAKTLFAQGFNFGLSVGDLGYKFGSEVSEDYNHSAVSLGVCTQYVFKDSLFGIEGNLLLYTTPPIYGSGAGAFAPYFFFNPAMSQPISAEFKLGLLVAHTFSSNTQPINDIGPSFGLYVYFVTRHSPEIGFDLSVFVGQKFYNLYTPGPLGAPPNPTYSSQVLTLNLSFKMLVL